MENQKKQVNNYNIIDFIKIIDISLLNLLDCIEEVNGLNSIVYDERGKIVIDLNSKCKKLLEGFIINNINDLIYYNRKNIVVNTCNPMKNWRQYERGRAIRENKFVIIDDSICVDENKLNNFANSIFEKLPSLKATLLKKVHFHETTSIDISISTGETIKFLEFDEIDLDDVCYLLKYYVSPIGSLIINNFNYNIIQDGNKGYSHKSEIFDEIKENFRLQLIEKGII